MALVLTDLEKVSLSVAFTTAAGNPAVVDGIPVWGTSDETILSVVAAEDGLTAVVTTVGPLGSAQVSVTADADLGEGVQLVQDGIVLTTEGALASSLGLVVGEISLK